MSSDLALSVEHLGKCYQIYDKPHHRLLQMLLARFGRTYCREFWALRDVSFQVPRGKVMGVLGKNGAGKSTLLQIICGTLAPTSGEVEARGRVAALLELGSGFNPEFTGVENIYLNGQILGLVREEIDAKLNAILDFADIGDFVHQPVKTYSSGMFARLAFAVAVNVEPDILIVDEALSVGDAWFQHKSMARMRHLMENGCSVLFVSHSVDAVRALCDEAIWLENGFVKMLGNVTDVTNAYMNEVFVEHNKIVFKSVFQDAAINEKTGIKKPATEKNERSIKDVAESVLNGLDSCAVLTVCAKELRNEHGQLVDHLLQGREFSFEFQVSFHQRVRNLSVGILIKDQFGQELTGESYFNTHRQSLDFEAGQMARFSFKSLMWLRGGQSYSVALRVNQVSKWDRSDNVIVFADEIAMVFDVLTDPDNPMWFIFKMPFEVQCQ